MAPWSMPTTRCATGGRRSSSCRRGSATEPRSNQNRALRDWRRCCSLVQCRLVSPFWAVSPENLLLLVRGAEVPGIGANAFRAPWFGVAELRASVGVTLAVQCGIQVGVQARMHRCCNKPVRKRERDREREREREGEGERDTQTHIDGETQRQGGRRRNRYKPHIRAYSTVVLAGAFPRETLWRDT